MKDIYKTVIVITIKETIVITKKMLLVAYKCSTEEIFFKFGFWVVWQRLRHFLLCMSNVGKTLLFHEYKKFHMKSDKWRIGAQWSCNFCFFLNQLLKFHHLLGHLGWMKLAWFGSKSIIFKSRMPLHLKSKTFVQCILPILIYGCETFKPPNEPWNVVC